MSFQGLKPPFILHFLKVYIECPSEQPPGVIARVSVVLLLEDGLGAWKGAKHQNFGILVQERGKASLFHVSETRIPEYFKLWK